MKNPFRWHFVELSNDRGGKKWAIRRWRGKWEYLDLISPGFAWGRADRHFSDSISADPEAVLEVYNDYVLTRSRTLSLDQFRRLVMKYRLRGDSK